MRELKWQNWWIEEIKFTRKRHEILATYERICRPESGQRQRQRQRPYGINLHDQIIMEEDANVFQALIIAAEKAKDQSKYYRTEPEW